MLPPREGHLEILCELFVYLKLHLVCMLLMDPWNLGLLMIVGSTSRMPEFDDWNTC